MVNALGAWTCVAAIIVTHKYSQVVGYSFALVNIGRGCTGSLHFLNNNFNPDWINTGVSTQCCVTHPFPINAISNQLFLSAHLPKSNPLKSQSIIFPYRQSPTKLKLTNLVNSLVSEWPLIPAWDVTDLEAFITLWPSSPSKLPPFLEAPINTLPSS